MKYTIYKNDVGQLMAMEGHCEFDGVVAKVFELELVTPEIHSQPETPLEHYWFNLGHNSNKIAQENNYLRQKLAVAEELINQIRACMVSQRGCICDQTVGFTCTECSIEKVCIEALAKIRGEG
jgi:hypothetical protein